MELLKATTRDQEVLVSHRNAALTLIQRRRIGAMVVEDGYSVSAAAVYFHVAWPTADRWATRYATARAASPDATVSLDDMADRSSRPHHSPTRTPAPVVRKIVHLRWRKRLGPVAIGAAVGMAPSTVHAVLLRCRVNRLSHIDRRTGEVVRRYEHPHPGALIHVDVKKLGNIPDGGGHRYVGRQQGDRHRAKTGCAGGAPTRAPAH